MPRYPNQRFYIETFGCQMNIADSIDIAYRLQESGLEEVHRPEDAHIVILNTCAVRESAEQRVRGRLGFYQSLKQKTAPLLILAGCMAQKDPQGLLSQFPQIDLLVGVHSKHRLPAILQDYIPSQSSRLEVEMGNYQFMDASPDQREYFKAYLNIIHGCNQYCSYCIVPYTRGREISRPSTDILHNVQQLAQQNVVEIMLLGQNVTAYGKDSQDLSLAILLRQLSQVEGIERIRFLAPHPADFSDELIEAIDEIPKVCRNFHLPLQSASNRVLQIMRRGYHYQQYQQLFHKLKRRFPNCTITTDLMVGTPGERLEDFQATINAVNELKFDSAFMYKYNERKGTPAVNLPEQVPMDERQRRLMELIDRQNAISYKQGQRFIGEVVRVLVERVSKQNPHEMLAKTGTNHPVILRGNPDMIGSFVDVKLQSFSGSTFRATVEK